MQTLNLTPTQLQTLKDRGELTIWVPMKEQPSGVLTQNVLNMESWIVMHDKMDVWTPMGEWCEKNRIVIGVYVPYETPMEINSGPWGCYSSEAAAEAAMREQQDADV